MDCIGEFQANESGESFRMSIILEDYLDYSRRRFTLEPDSLKVSEAYKAKHESDAVFFRNSAGYGAILTTVFRPTRRIFAALYVHDRSLNLLIDSQLYKYEPTLKCKNEAFLPCVRTFSLLEDQTLLVSFRYLSFDHDFLIYTYEHIRDSYQAKAFSYIWSASAIGRDRLLDDRGLIREVLDKIDDPFDTSVDFVRGSVVWPLQ
jgi:hypothetical protein